MKSIIFPWPDARLLPNRKSKLHRIVANRIVQAARTEAFYEVKAQAPRKHGLTAPVSVTLEFTPPKRSGPIPDQDNMVAMMKAPLDGISDAIKIDDRHFELEKPIIHKREGNGQVKVILANVKEQSG